MSNADLSASDHRSTDPTATPSRPSPRASFWLRELPYAAVLVLTILGIAYTSYSKQSIVAYWEFLAPVIALVCVGSGWRHAHDKEARLRLVWTQALHWFAFLVAMNLVLLPGVQRIMNANASDLAILMLLALGTFTAGVHILVWQVCLVGIVMALGVPAIAWMEQSSLLLLLGLWLWSVSAWHSGGAGGALTRPNIGGMLAEVLQACACRSKRQSRRALGEQD